MTDIETEAVPVTVEEMLRDPTGGPAAEAVQTIHSLEEWKAIKTEAGMNMVLLQCGSPLCTRCPDFTAAVGVLKQEFQFKHVYVNTHDAEEDLLEMLQVAQLPAYLLVKGGASWQKQAATPSDVSLAVARNCTPVFTCDADF
jgi:thiol-disulfide isomerase/thioredoxin